jgi:LCP family protein required for cell wall assembly
MRSNPFLRLLIAIPMCGLLVAGMLGATWLALGQPNPASGTTWFQVTKVGDAEFSGAPDAPFFFLALGNDGRSDADKGLGDAIHVFGVNPATHTATVLNVPRDTDAPSGDKINSYHSLQGLPGMVGELNKMMGINIQYAITTNFPGFVAMVNEIGGIDVNLKEAYHDPQYSGAEFPAGPQHVDGDQALAISRNRHQWTTGDIERTANQAQVILDTLAMLRAKQTGDAGTLGLVATLAKHVTTENVSLTDLYRLGRLALTIDPATVKNVTVPVGSGAGTELQLTGDAQSLFADFADDGILQTH